MLNGFSKVCERYFLNSLSNHIEKILSTFIAAYRKTYSSSHVLIRLIENWKKHLDNKKIVGTVLMDLSKAFDCIPHYLLIAKLRVYGFDKKALTFLFLILKTQETKCWNKIIRKASFKSFYQEYPKDPFLGLLFLIVL